MRYVIGVDGGGTKTEAVAFDMNGNVLKAATKGFGNLLNDKEKALSNIKNAIEELTNSLGLDCVDAIYLGLAGSEFGDIALLVEKELIGKFNTTCKVMNDGELALKALLKGEDGILTIAGTGSICFGVKDGKLERAGGWGNLLGDEGSGYKIAIEAIKLMIHDKDYNLPKSELSNSILKYLNIDDVDKIVDFVYKATKDDIAALAKLVAEHAEGGDEASKNILVKEGISLAKTTECVYNKLYFKQCNIGLVGGVVKKSKVLRAAFEQYLSDNIKVLHFIDEDMSPAKGAYYIYKNHLNEGEN
jgi:N-acetylglucosamine kinase-like BadF-type ATPase